ncbi:hypothetical protein HDA32_004314 [Spinactinospora alkalitolerans]|uniref:Uncharacterized protein n=1 Tax=Spinactinospora alkalitolerans TaxID=687207 RepID=A0A852U537_9ACTN|nr:hypothetical protein [Spinactinospora alkalitolerans]NYE49194.1 hypothetical protein [Spinactinospora alkalitolerans]
MPNRHRADTDRGSAAVEWSALLLLLAAIAAVVVLSVPSPIGQAVDSAICQVLGDHCEGSSADPESTPEGHEDGPGMREADYLPPLCEVNSDSESSSFTVKIGIYGGAETQFQRQEMADGSVWITVQPSNRAVGAEVGTPGAKIKGGETADLGASAEVGGEGQWGEGMIWTFGPDERDEADALERRIVEEGQISQNPVVAWWDSLWSDEEDSGLPPPDMLLDHEGGEGSLTGQAGVGLKIPGTGDERGERQLDIGQGADGAIEGAGGVITRTDNRGPETLISDTYYANGSISGNGEYFLGVGAGGAVAWQAQIRQTRDEEGELQSILLRADFDNEVNFRGRLPFGVGPHRPNTSGQTELAAGRTTTLIQVELDTPEQREIGERFLRDNAGVVGTANYFLETMQGDDGSVTEDPGPGGDPWERLMYERGQVWTTSHDREYTDSEIGAEVKPFIPIGGGYATSEETRRTEEAEYLGAPQDGRRTFQPYDACEQ